MNEQKIAHLKELEDLQKSLHMYLHMYDESSEWSEPSFINFLFDLNLKIFNLLNGLVRFYRKIIFSNKVLRKLFGVKPKTIINMNGLKIGIKSWKYHGPSQQVRCNSPYERAEHMGLPLYGKQD